MSASNTERVFGGGGANGNRIWWPAGLHDLSPAERVEALERGWWRDGDHIVTTAGERRKADTDAA